ncbi:hypothetical protein SLS58_007289 [Diplodia intermedia]|uniref:Uncharacterized protein n=1 Tax=Diplodia intermedia TaxID=856260 RepID=A0ABR3TKW6_9PEZI
MEEADMVIVGAGFAGLAMARTYLMLNPATNLVILDAGTTIGGVWAGDRLYPHLRTISQLGHFEYSDFPMAGYYDVDEGEHMRGEVMQRYLQDYASAFDLTRRTRLNTVVREAEDKGAAGWLLTVQTTTTDDDTTPQQEHHYHLLAAKLVVATGLTSTPSMPTFADQSTFTAPLLHSRDFGRHAASILGREAGSKEEEEEEKKTTTTTIAVLSGNKSACDVVYAACAASRDPPATPAVHWILRASGHGPCWMAPARTPGNALVEELITTRFHTWLASPCVWGPADGFGWVRALLDRTAWGRGLGAGAARGAQERLERRNGYDDGDEMAKLRPWSDAFWIGTGRGLLNYGDPGLLEYVREGRVRVHVADVDGLGPGGAVRLSNGEEIAGVAALVCCTGWRHEPSIRFVGDDGGGGGRRDIAAELGLPHAYDPAVDDAARKAALARADEEILSALPRLRDQPPPATCPAHHLAAQRAEVRAAVVAKRAATAEEDDDPVRSLAQAYTLYRFMVPPSRTARPHRRRTIAFIGCTRTASTALMAQTQALWLSAFFMGRLPHLDNDDDDTVAYESVLHARQNRWRHPLGFGARVPDFTHDALPYMDLLLRELGLPRWRKRCSFLPSSSFFRLPSLWREVFEWYGPADYRGLVEEWAAKEEGVVLRGGGGDDDDFAGVGRRRKATPLFSATNGVFLVTAVLGAVAAGWAWIGTGRRR